MCQCQFDPYPGEPEEESFHFYRTCVSCGHSWYGLHCPHDRAQNNCPGCDKRPDPVDDDETNA